MPQGAALFRGTPGLFLNDRVKRLIFRSAVCPSLPAWEGFDGEGGRGLFH